MNNGGYYLNNMKTTTLIQIILALLISLVLLFAVLFDSKKYEPTELPTNPIPKVETPVNTDQGKG